MKLVLDRSALLQDKLWSWHALCFSGLKKYFSLEILMLYLGQFHCIFKVSLDLTCPNIRAISSHSKILIRVNAWICDNLSIPSLDFHCGTIVKICTEAHLLVKAILQNGACVQHHFCR